MTTEIDLALSNAELLLGEARLLFGGRAVKFKQESRITRLALMLLQYDKSEVTLVTGTDTHKPPYPSQYSYYIKIGYLPDSRKQIWGCVLKPR
jgi:hypothetical protein